MSTWSAAFGAASADAIHAYEESMVGGVFVPWAELLCDEVGIKSGDAVLDVACGPGSVTRLAARRTGPTGRVVGCDLSHAMLAVARAKPPLESAAPIEYRESPETPLAAEDAAYDVVLCQQGLQFFPDRAGGVREMKRALRSGGRAAIATWVTIERNTPWRAIYRALGQVVGPELAEKYRAGPWGLTDADELEGLLRDAAFDNVRIYERELDCVFPGGPDQVLLTIPASGVAENVAALSAEQQDEIAKIVRAELEPFTDAGTLRCPTASLIAIASA